MPDGLTFDPVKHQYRFHGLRVPGVTTILRSVRLIDFEGVGRGVLDAARERGHAVHDAVMFDCDGALDEATVDAEFLGYVDAARQWRLDCHFEPVGVEYALYHPTYRYAGTADLVGWLNGEPAVVDWKTGRASDVCADLQLGAYGAALRQLPPVEWFDMTGGTPIMRIGVELHADGTYRSHRYTRAQDFALFLNALTIYREQERRGLRECVA